MNKLNIKNLLTAIQNMIMRNRVAYKDYLGKETVVKPVLLASGLSFSGQPSVSFELIEGQSYDIDFGDERITLTAGCRQCAEDMPEDVSSWVSVTPELDNFPNDYLLSIDTSTFPDNSFRIQIYDGLMFTYSTGKYADKDFDLYRNDLVTTNRYDIKLLPEELLPKSVAKKKDVNSQFTLVNRKVDSIKNRVTSVGDLVYTKVCYDQDQFLTASQKAQARKNIDASDFSGSYHDLQDKPCENYERRTEVYTLTGGMNVRVGDGDEAYTVTTGYTSQLVPQDSIVRVCGKTWESPKIGVQSILVGEGMECRYVGNLSMITKILFVKNSFGGFQSSKYPTSGDDTGEDFLFIISCVKSDGHSVYDFYYVVSSKKYADSKLCAVVDELIKLDDALIPNNIQRVGSDLIINSSTEGSTKKFKLVVDDSGEVSATEVAG